MTFLPTLHLAALGPVREEEVIFMRRGMLAIGTPQCSVVLGAGDTFTTPKGLARAFRALSSDWVIAYVVRGGGGAGAVRFPKPIAAE